MSESASSSPSSGRRPPKARPRTAARVGAVQALFQRDAEFGAAAYGMGIHYLGVCCGAGPHHVRALAEAVGKRPPAMRYTADMSKHYLFGRATLGKTSRQKAEDRRFAKAIVQA